MCEGAEIICFPECYVPGYRGLGFKVPPPDAAFLKQAHDAVAKAAKEAKTAVILGTERISDTQLHISAIVIDDYGTILGYQDKVQLDPTEDGPYVPGSERRVFNAAGLRFGVAICHEGFRYPETVRFAARRGAQVVFHPHFDVARADGYRPRIYGDPENTFHEKAALCRAAENTIYFATVNCAVLGSATTSAFIAPDGTLIAHQPYGEDGLLIANLDLGLATGLLASRLRPS